MSSFIRRAAIGAIAAVAALVVSSAPAQADGGSGLNAADMTLLIGLRRAALWQIPAAKSAAHRGSTAKIRQVGQKLAAAQSQLDRETADVIGKLHVTVRPALTAQQQDLLN